MQAASHPERRALPAGPKWRKQLDTCRSSCHPGARGSVPCLQHRGLFFLFSFALNWHVASFRVLVKCTHRRRCGHTLARIYRILVLKQVTGSNWDQVGEKYLQGRFAKRLQSRPVHRTPADRGCPPALRARGAFTPPGSSPSQFGSVCCD